MRVREVKDRELFLEMTGASDRASAIVAVAYLEDRLTQAIKANLRDDKDTTKQLFKPTGPLGQLGNKILLGYLLNLYSKEFRSDLSLFADVRNMFAHWNRPLHFGYKDVRTKIEDLVFSVRLFGKHSPSCMPRPFDHEHAKYVFVSTADLMAGHLEAIANNPKHPRVL